jgi:hypothetical protein
VFAGLAILGTEFTGRSGCAGFSTVATTPGPGWLRSQPHGVRLLIMALTGAFALITLWLLDTFGLIAGWVGLPWAWVQSPFA